MNAILNKNATSLAGAVRFIFVFDLGWRGGET
jgi:hypothetical protein